VSVEAPVDRWRGVASEEIDEFSPSVAGLLRRRSRRLLFGLAKPYRWEIALAGVLILVRSAAYLALPYLVGLGIDAGIRPGRTGNLRTLVVVVAALLFALMVNAAANYAFLRLSGRIGADILFDLRRALFAHMQELSLSFYERYTSGRIISRLTSDIDALNELLATGLTSVITSVISVVAITRDKTNLKFIMQGSYKVAAGLYRPSGFKTRLIPIRQQQYFFFSRHYFSPANIPAQ